MRAKVQALEEELQSVRHQQTSAPPPATPRTPTNLVAVDEEVVGSDRSAMPSAIADALEAAVAQSATAAQRAGEMGDAIAKAKEDAAAHWSVGAVRLSLIHI